MSEHSDLKYVGIVATIIGGTILVFGLIGVAVTLYSQDFSPRGTRKATRGGDPRRFHRDESSRTEPLSSADVSSSSSFFLGEMVAGVFVGSQARSRLDGLCEI